MWDATNSGTFSVAYSDGSFSAQGSFSSGANFGEMGTERNGSFVDEDERAAAASVSLAAEQNPSSLAGAQSNKAATPPANTPKFRGRIPVSSLVH